MAMKGYSPFPKSPRMEPRHQNVLCHIQVGVLPFCKNAVDVFYILNQLNCLLEYTGTFLLWGPYPSHHNGLFSPLLVLRDFAAKGQMNIGVIRTVRDFLPFSETLSFLCNIICNLISVFGFSLVTLSEATKYWRRGTRTKKRDSPKNLNRLITQHTGEDTSQQQRDA